MRRAILIAAVAAFTAAGGYAAAQDTLKIGASAPKTGPLAGGAAVTHWPNIKLWVSDVNKRGGLKVGGKTMKIELVEYDDRTSGEEAVKNIQRLATIDKVDFIVTPYATGINVATAPIIARYNYPHIATTAATAKVPEFAKRWPNSFWLLGTSGQLADGAVEAMVKARNAGYIGKRLALVHIAHDFGLELIGVAKAAFQKAGFELVYEANYPLGTQDLAPIISGAKAAKAEAFVAFSYPPDTFALTEQAQIQGLNVGAFYVGVGAAFPGYGGKFGSKANGVIGMGGVNTDAKEIQDYRRRHKEITGVDADYWASAMTYAGLQVLEQAIVRAGTTDRAKVIEAIRKTPAKTIMGEIKLADNINHNVWTAGQWQNGLFRGIASKGIPGTVKLIKKDGWK
jgi:branched-chain amino acid transport system substrate-binding protein